jgi:hypothetical protein
MIFNRFFKRNCYLDAVDAIAKRNYNVFNLYSPRVIINVFNNRVSLLCNGFLFYVCKTPLRSGSKSS